MGVSASVRTRERIRTHCRRYVTAWRGACRWFRMQGDGTVMCLACSKVSDEVHNVTDTHNRRVESWVAAEEIRLSNFPPPREPWLAWVLFDENDPSSERSQRCLLCSKWVNDDSSHSDGPGQSKEHAKNLRNNHPSDRWWIDNVTKVREKWHPTAKKASTQQATTPTQWAQHGKGSRPALTGYAQASTQQGTTPAPWASCGKGDPNGYGGKASMQQGTVPDPWATYRKDSPEANGGKAATANGKGRGEAQRADSASASEAASAGPPKPVHIGGGWWKTTADSGLPYFYTADGRVTWDEPILQEQEEEICYVRAEARDDEEDA